MFSLNHSASLKRLNQSMVLSYRLGFVEAAPKAALHPALNSFSRRDEFRYVAEMRITSGILRNRRLAVPDKEVRPTMEAVREAIFSSLGGTCEGLKVLDLFAGSGALGLEAWSRGAASVVFVERHPAVWSNLQRNVEELACAGLGRTSCIKADAVKWLERASGSFDLILADPPYDLPDAMQQTLEGIARHSVLTPDGILVYEMRSKGDPAGLDDWEVLRDKRYGKTRVLILRPKNKEVL
jgi:16S rRNA (guanine966-N2)-methyltransferase